MFDIFKKYLSDRDVYNHELYPTLINVIGGLWITLSFIVVGAVIIYIANIHKNNFRKREIVTKVFGWSLIACGFSRAIEVLCMWDNLAILYGWSKIATGILMSSVLVYIPYLVRKIMSQNTMNEIKATLKETTEKVDTIKELGDKIGAK